MMKYNQLRYFFIRFLQDWRCQEIHTLKRNAHFNEIQFNTLTDLVITVNYQLEQKGKRKTAKKVNKIKDK